MELQEIFILATSGAVTWWIGAFFTNIKMKKSFNYKLIENLYEKRYNTYTKLLEITQDIWKSETSFDNHKKALLWLKEWQKTSWWFLLLSNKAYRYFSDLKEILSKGKADKDDYSKEQKKKIFKKRNEFRWSLRDEFAFFHNAEMSVS